MVKVLKVAANNKVSLGHDKGQAWSDKGLGPYNILLSIFQFILLSYVLDW